ncbi:MAG: hypothetical protein E7207_02450 [Clostridium butyricum]|nr:hypothetical protein [Clostridium butyricum]
MALLYVFIIGIALAMDAFGVALGIGLNPILERRHKIKFVVSFSFFQFLFTFIGGNMGHLFEVYIADIPSVVGGIIMELVGTLMIIDGFEEKANKMLIKNSTCLILGISVSIDALVIGFTTFHKIANLITLFYYSSIIGFITVLFSNGAFIIGRCIKKIDFVAKYANFFGGTALIIFGFKMIFF